MTVKNEVQEEEKKRKPLRAEDLCSETLTEVATELGVSERVLVAEINRFRDILEAIGGLGEGVSDDGKIDLNYLGEQFIKLVREARQKHIRGNQKLQAAALTSLVRWHQSTHVYKSVLERVEDELSSARQENARFIEENARLEQTLTAYKQENGLLRDSLTSAKNTQKICKDNAIKLRSIIDMLTNNQGEMLHRIAGSLIDSCDR